MNSSRKLTSREAYNRLFWDSRIQRDAFAIVYADRATASGTNETSLVRWDPQGSIPWHRILRIRCGDEIVWSKDGEEDFLDFDQLPAAGRAPETVAPAAEIHGDRLRPRRVYRHLHATWESTEAAGVVPATGALRVVSWNVLYDFADPDLVPVRVRLPHLLAELEQCNADIVALQEATPELLRELLAVPRNFPLYLSESPAMSGIEPHGVCLLSRHPFTLTEYAAGKRPILVGSWRFPDRLLHVANLHLPSNRAADATRQRSRLLEGLFTELTPFAGDVLAAGDFNLVGSELDDLFETFGYEDVWSRLCPGVEGITYDPPANPLARANSRNGLPVRFDRILWRPSATPFAPTEIERFATQPDLELPGGFPSDHYGLCSRWTWGTDSEAPPSGGSPRRLATGMEDDASLNEWLERLHPEAGERRQAAADDIRRQLSEIVADLTGWPNAVEIAGSWRLGVAHPDSDLDFTAVIPDRLDRPRFIQQVQERLRGQAEELQFAAAARVPKLTFRMQGHSVDLLTASVSRPPRQSLTECSADDFSDPEGWQIVRACRESDLILETVRQVIPLATFRLLLRAVRAWAKIRRLQGNAWGFLGGFPWAMLTAWSVLQRAELATSDPEIPVADWLANFFRSLSRHPWPEPIGVTAEAAEYQPSGPRDRLPIIRPTLPLENSAYNITRSTAAILRAEWTRAARLFASSESIPETLRELFAPADPRRESPLSLVVTLNGTESLLREFAGLWEGHYVGLLIHLERELHLGVRPWPGLQHAGDGSRFVIGLPLLRPVDRTGIRQAVDELLSQLPASSQLRWRSEIVAADEVE